MPQFTNAAEYESREAALASPKVPIWSDAEYLIERLGTASPTLSQLLRMENDGSFVTVRVPVTTPDRVLYDSISFNTNIEFLPGHEYTLHPIVAKELYRAIRNHAEAITKQKTGRTIESSDLMGELKRQEEAERLMFEQFAKAGVFD